MTESSEPSGIILYAPAPLPAPVEESLVFGGNRDGGEAMGTANNRAPQVQSQTSSPKADSTVDSQDERQRDESAKATGRWVSGSASPEPVLNGEKSQFDQPQQDEDLHHNKSSLRVTVVPDERVETKPQSAVAPSPTLADIEEGRSGRGTSKTANSVEAAAPSPRAKTDPKKPALPRQTMIRTLLLTLSVCMGSVAFGFQLGYTGPISALPHTPSAFGDQFALFSSLISIGAAGGGIMGGFLADRFGRKATLIGNVFPYAGAMIGMYFADDSSLLLCLRVIAGISVGILTAAVPMYITESVPTEMRGAMGGGIQLFIVIGELMAYIAGWPMTKGDDSYEFWREAALTALIPIVLQGVSMLFLPESPVWLYKTGKPESEIRDVLRRLRGPDYDRIDEEMQQLAESNAVSSSSSAENSHPSSPNHHHHHLHLHLHSSSVVDSSGLQMSPMRTGGNNNNNMLSSLDHSDPIHHSDVSGILHHHTPSMPSPTLFQSRMVMPLIVGCGLNLFQQLTGINGVIFYSGKIFSAASVATGPSMLIIAIVQVVVTVVACAMLDRAGRRPLLIFGSAGMGLSMFLLGIYFQFSSTIPSFVAVLAACLYIASFSLSMGPIPILAAAEVYPNSTRGVAMSLTTVLNWMAAFAVVQSVGGLFDASPPGTFWMFGGICFFCFIFSMILVPETKGRGFEEIEGEFKSQSLARHFYRDNDVSIITPDHSMVHP